MSDQNYPFAIHLADVETFNTEENLLIISAFLHGQKSGGKAR